jgi:DNA-binding NarL/FixJ family response regulator
MPPLADPALAAGPTPVSVLVVAPHELVLHGMRALLAGRPWVRRYVPVQAVSSAVVLARRFEPTVALVDVKQDGCSAEDACIAIRCAAPTTRVLLLTPADHVPQRTVAGMGATGFVSKAWPSDEIVAAVRLAGRGLPQRPAKHRGAAEGLSARQQEVLQLLAEGGTNDEIARVLHVSLNTVKQHASALYRKLEVRNRAEAIGRAQAMGLLA